MALSDETIVQQIEILAKKLSENPDMVYKSIPALNNALNPKYFSGHDTKIVNAINKLAAELNIANNAIVDLINKNNKVLSDIYSADNKQDWEETKDLMGTNNIIDGIKLILEGKQQENILQLDVSDIGKLLSVVQNEENGSLEVKAISTDSIAVEVDSYNIPYTNIEYKEINNVGEAIDVILESVPQLANDLMIEDNELVLKTVDDKELANIPITNDADINNIIDLLDE